MFTITRRRGEALVVCAPGLKPFRFTVEQLRKGAARIRCDGPTDYAVHRGELYDKASPPTAPLVALTEEDAARVREAAKAVAPDGS